MNEVFSANYKEARQRFRAAAAAIGAESVAITLEPDGTRDLSVDVAIFGNRSANSAIVVSSGCHGVEGFFGSAIQLAWLQSLAENSRQLDRRCVLIHAINPYGFDCLRRFNEENVDLNRNFLVDASRYQGSPADYPELDRLLNPKSPPPRLEFFRLRSLLSIWEAGRRATRSEPFRLRNVSRIWARGLQSIKAAVAGGQYEFPEGLFYGGKGPCRSTRIVQDHFESWIANANRVVHIDLHSGLGQSADYKMLLIDAEESTSYKWFASTFGENHVQPAEKADGVAYSASGIMGEWLKAKLSSRDYRFAAAEFGTYDVIRVLGAIRAENRAHFHGTAGSHAVQSAKAELLECFCPARPQWRQQVLRSGLDIIEKCLRSG